MRIISVLKTNYSLKFKNFCTASQNFAYPTCIHSFFTPDGSCKWMEEWNAYKCQGLDHLMLVIESMDGDSETRRVSPLALVGEGAWHYTDLLNGPMDHGQYVFTTIGYFNVCLVINMIIWYLLVVKN